MKVIAQLPDERVLISVTGNEFANLLGQYSKYDIKREDVNAFISEAKEVDISDIYMKHRLIFEMQNTDTMKEARNKLERLLFTLTPIESKVSALAKVTKK